MRKDTMDLKHFIRDIPDFPKEGIVFKDITPLLLDGAALRHTVDQMCAPFRDKQIKAVCGIESRGFIFGTAVAHELHCGFIPIRKVGKLPYKTVSVEYELEYGTDHVEVHEDAISEGDKILIVDDLLATGGTMHAACQLVEKLGGVVQSCVLAVELDFLNGRDKLAGRSVMSLVHYE